MDAASIVTSGNPESDKLAIRVVAEAYLSALLPDGYPPENQDEATENYAAIRQERVNAGAAMLAAGGFKPVRLVFGPVHDTRGGGDEDQDEVDTHLTNPDSSLNDPWLEAIARDVRMVCGINKRLSDDGKPGSMETEHAIKKIVAWITAAALPAMQPIRLTDAGELVLDRGDDWLPNVAGKPWHRPQFDDELRAARFNAGLATGRVGVHAGCGGMLVLRPSSHAGRNRLHCEGCGAGIGLPSDLKTYGELNDYCKQGYRP